MMMGYRIVHYDKKTERMIGSRPVPSSVVLKVKRIAGAAPLDDDLGEYNLNEQQVHRIADILGFSPSVELFYYSLDPYRNAEVMP